MFESVSLFNYYTQAENSPLNIYKYYITSVGTKNIKDNILNWTNILFFSLLLNYTTADDFWKKFNEHSRRVSIVER